jgi:hypothetical protein
VKGLFRVIVLVAAAALFAWFFLNLGPDRPVGPPSREPGSIVVPPEPSPREPRTQEEWAVWRERIDQRLQR